MAVVRVEKTKNYTTMCNDHLKDINLSLKAKGLLSIMLSLPDEWHYSVKGLKGICKESANTINKILQELEENGYLIRKKKYFNGKISEWEYIIFESKEKKNLYLKNEDIENEYIENEDVENRDVYKITNKSNTKELNTNRCNNIYTHFSNEQYADNKKSSTLKEKNSNNNEIITEIVNYLNEKTNKSFRSNSSNTKKFINARINEGYTLDDFKQVIDVKTKQWKKDKEMSKYLRPSTLFGNKFENYLNEEQKKLTIANPVFDDVDDEIDF